MQKSEMEDDCIVTLPGTRPARPIVHHQFWLKGDAVSTTETQLPNPRVLTLILKVNAQSYSQTSYKIYKVQFLTAPPQMC